MEAVFQLPIFPFFCCVCANAQCIINRKNITLVNVKKKQSFLVKFEEIYDIKSNIKNLHYDAHKNDLIKVAVWQNAQEYYKDIQD